MFAPSLVFCSRNLSKDQKGLTKPFCLSSFETTLTKFKMTFFVYQAINENMERRDQEALAEQKRQQRLEDDHKKLQQTNSSPTNNLSSKQGGKFCLYLFN